MTFVIPTAVHQMTADWDTDARARGAFAGTLEAQPGTRNTKGNGNLPITNSATGFVNSQGSSATGPLRGVYWEFLATGGYNVSSDTKVMVWTWQFNAPNRIQCATAANDGVVVRLGTGSGTPPANYRTWQIAGNDKVGGQARENPKMIVMDLNVTDHNALIGTYDNTDVQTVGFGTVRFDLSGGSTIQHFHQRLFIFDTTKGASDIPTFTGVSDWDDTVTAMGTTYTTKITDEWIKREGAIFSYAAPMQIGDNSTSTQFNDNGVTVFWPNSNDVNDPRVHVTNQAFRVYLNLRNNVADTAALSGFYDCGNSYPDWDFGQGDSAVVTLSGPTFKRTGQFDVGSSVTGNAVFDDCGLVYLNDVDSDLDGSTFRNPNGTHLLRLHEVGAGATSPSTTGTPLSITWGSGTNPATQDITIPSDCTAVYVFWAYYNSGAGNGLSTITLEAVSPDQTSELATVSNGAAIGVAAWYNPTTGASQTLDVSWDASPDEGAVTTVVFVKDGNVTSWRNVGIGQSNDQFSAVSTTLTTVSDDLVIKHDIRIAATSPSLSSGWTDQNTQVNNNFMSSRNSSIIATSSTEVCDCEDEEYSSVIAISIEAL